MFVQATAPSGSLATGSEKKDHRAYRTSHVQGLALPSDLVERIGFLNREGNLTPDLFIYARAAYLQRRAGLDDSPTLDYHDGRTAHRQRDSFIKSVQGFAEDLWRRVDKRIVPDDPLGHDEFRVVYERVRKTFQRRIRKDGILWDLGAAVNGNRLDRCLHGKRWTIVPDALDGPPSGPAELVRSTGPEPSMPEGEHVDVMAYMERFSAWKRQLHREFSHAETSGRLDRGRRSGDAVRFMQRHARKPDGRPHYVTIGAWRPDEVDQRRKDRACTVPWITAEIDGRTDGRKDRTKTFQLARRLLKRLRRHGLDLRTVVVAFTGNCSIHVRIPHGAVGCPVYGDENTATRSLYRFFSRLCGRDTELMAAIDPACFSPRQLIRVLGSTHESVEGVYCAGTDGLTFMERPDVFLVAVCEFPSAIGFTVKNPERPPFNRALFRLLATSERPGPHASVPQSVSHRENAPVCVGGGSVVARVSGGVSEGETWGSDVGKPAWSGRNWAALIMALHVLSGEGTRLERMARLRAWSGRCDPPLPDHELERVFRKAERFLNGPDRRSARVKLNLAGSRILTSVPQSVSRMG